VTRSALDTPMMRQYLALKERHPDAILFYRMGDFYEMFLADAELAAPLLDIALTTRDKGKPDAVPMCGVPVHAADGHLKRLVELGYRVAICEQVEDPKAAKGLVRRDVVEVLTPGLVGDPETIDARRELSLVAIAGVGTEIGLAALDASTGAFRATTCRAEGEELPPAVLGELERIDPREVLLPAADAERLTPILRKHLPKASLTPLPREAFDPAQAPHEPDGFAALARTAGGRAAAAVLRYLADHQPFALRSATRLRAYAVSDAMVLDAATRAHLELFESSEDRSRRGTLVERLDATQTALGARRLARWLARPLLDPAEIAARQDAVAWLAERDRLRARVRGALRAVRDLERLAAKSARPGATPRDLAALGRSLGALGAVAAELATEDDELKKGSDPFFSQLATASDPRPQALPVVAPIPAAEQLLSEALVDDPPVLLRGSRGAGETGFVRAGFRADLDALRESTVKGREWIAGLETRERERLGLASLKVRFHPVLGYAIEVGKAHLARVPAEYERKQTLAGAERFTTPELRERESLVLGANERAAALEREIFESVRQQLLEFMRPMQDAADAVARLDALASLAEVARREGWTRPEVDGSRRLEIRAGRHPVVERALAERSAGEFVPNDTALDPEQTQILLITGPNMSGKSTYLRQVALIALLAQVGSFVPAEAARIGVVDRIFTRVGASDRLARGESTFMVEMRETAEILAQASPRSLVILDEIGRGTSTFDGLSIAWAVAEYLHDTPALGARTLFATHYHELADLAGLRERVRNGHFEVREWGDDVVFLRRLVAGPASRSYGIQVARLAGMPSPVIRRAREILAALESGELRMRELAQGDAPSPQLALFAPVRESSAAPAGATEAERDVLAALRAAAPDATTPIDALLLLQRLVARLREEGDA
jgi:DNA mismatch repair protein MutS